VEGEAVTGRTRGVRIYPTESDRLLKRNNKICFDDQGVLKICDENKISATPYLGQELREESSGR
jgi:hypothetical protein